MQQFPIFGIAGNRGDGKTLTMTALGLMYHAEGKPIIANYNLYGVPYRKAGIKAAMEHLKELENHILLFDEVKTGADAYKFWTKDAVAFTDFISQTRKRHIVVMMTFQRFRTLPVRLREMIDYFIQVEQVKDGTPGDTLAQIFDAYAMPGSDHIKDIVVHGATVFNRYDTDELIRADDTTWEPVGIKSKNGLPQRPPKKR